VEELEFFPKLLGSINIVNEPRGVFDYRQKTCCDVVFGAKKLSTRTLSGFHGIARPPSIPMESMAMEQPFFQILEIMLSKTTLEHLVSWRRTIFDDFECNLFCTSLCLILPLRPQIFYEITLIGN